MSKDNHIDLMLTEVIQLHLAKHGTERTMQELSQRLVGLVDASGKS